MSLKGVQREEEEKMHGGWNQERNGDAGNQSRVGRGGRRPRGF